MRNSLSLFLVSALLFLFGIGFVIVGARAATRADQAAPTSATAGIAPVASTKQIMAGIAAPASTAIFDAVQTNATEKGTQEIAPDTDEEWAALGAQAAVLAEAGNMLLADGRMVDKGDWVTMSRAMIDAARQTMKAVEAKSTDGVLDAGSAVNLTCDNCHARYRRQ